MNPTTVNQYKAENIRKLAQWHKDTCKQEDCDISLYPLIEIFEMYKGDKATDSEMKAFL